MDTNQQIRAVAEELTERTQIPYKYYELDSLFLINASFSEDSLQEYYVYKKDGPSETYSAVDSVTVSWMTVERLENLLKEHNNATLEELEVFPVLGWNSVLSFKRMEMFKEEFSVFAKQY